MKKTILFVLLFTCLAFAQYGAKENINAETWTGATGTTPPSGWIGSSSVDSYTVLSGDTLRIRNSSSGGTGNTRRTYTVPTGATYKVTYLGAGGAASPALQMGTTIGGTEYLYTGGSGDYTFTTTSTTLHIRLLNQSATALADGYYDDVILRIKLDTLYISPTGNDANAGTKAAPIKTIAEALNRGFYDGGYFAFESGGTWNETFTAGNNTNMIVFGGTSPVTIATINNNGYTVNVSSLINPSHVCKKSGFGGWAGW
jgi:hypothetical protein